jgi:hypothetical protein
VGFGHEGCSALLPANHELDLALTRMQPVEHSQITFTRNAEGVGDALGDQTVNEKVAGNLFSHPNIVPQLRSRTQPWRTLPEGYASC